MAKKGKQAIPVYYWDAGVFLAYICEEVGRYETVTNLLEECDNGNVHIWTSTLSIAEVAKGKIDPGKIIPLKVQRKIDALWEPPSRIKLIEVTQSVVKEARNVIRAIHGSKKTGIRSVDAIHIASAIQREIKELHTYDDDLPKFAEIVDLKIVKPHCDKLPFTGPMNETTEEESEDGSEE
jgi:predicted nucleic acid-binding protein